MSISDEPDAGLAAIADDVAAEAASFVASVESVAAGTDPGAAVSVLILALSGILATGAKLGAREDFATDGPAPHARVRREAGPQEVPQTGQLRSALAEQFGAVDSYHDVVDPYIGHEVTVSLLSDDLASIAGDLLQGLGLYTDGSITDALAWWQYSYLSNWGPSASACLRAVQSLLGLVRLGEPLGVPGDQFPL